MARRPPRRRAPYPSTDLEPFQPLITTVRWGTVVVGLVLSFSAHTRAPEIASGVALTINAAVRTRWPVRAGSDSIDGLTFAFLELALALAAVLSTGYWESPYLFCVVVPVVIAGFSRSFMPAIVISLIAAAAVSVPAVVTGEGDIARLTTAGFAEIFLIALVAAYARRLFGEAEQRATQVLNRMSRLNEANDLLLALNQVAQTLPASLDLKETVTSTIDQVRSMVHADVVAVLLWESSLMRWSVGVVQGARLPDVVEPGAVPVAIQRTSRSALRDPSPVRVDLREDGPGLSAASRGAIYAPLVARKTLVGVLAVECHDPDALAERDLPLMAGLAEQAALAIDNAQWFSRLRTLGAEEERNRIARDLHDRVAQSLAYLAFELDRITAAAKSRPVNDELETLRHDVRHVVTEVRDTLYDLRTNVSETQDLIQTLDGFLDRVSTRSGLRVRFEHEVVMRRLPVPVERELWRIAEEAITNVERHAKATQVTVVWEVDSAEAHLTILDNGRGFPVGAAGRFDSYGLLGMRERADAIGATLEIESQPGLGTAVRCRMEVP